MRMHRKISLLVLASALLLPTAAMAQRVNFKEIEAKVSEYGKWLEQTNSNGSRFWVKLDSSHRPHRLYVAEGFMRAEYKVKEHFVEIFSRFLAGHPEKNMLIDIFEAKTGKAIGEYGFGGFKLF
jgi:hypothetical protein